MSIETELDMSLAKGDSLAGCLLSIEGKLPVLTEFLKLNYNLFPEVYGVGGHVKVDNVKASEMLLLSINTSMSLGVIKHLKKNEIELNLKVPVIAFKEDNVGIARNLNGHWRLIGYGEIL